MDAHAYWDHPEFPHRAWDPRDWQIHNTPMVDAAESATLWSLAGIRVAGKPFTVTEYNHPAPNDYQAETVPMIATYAAMQDWDAVFLFAYSHNGALTRRARKRVFLILKATRSKVGLMPLGSRIFVGQAMTALPAAKTAHFTPGELALQTPGHYYNLPAITRETFKVPWGDFLLNRWQTDLSAKELRLDNAGPVRTTTSAARQRRRLATGASSCIVAGGTAGDEPVYCQRARGRRYWWDFRISGFRFPWGRWRCWRPMRQFVTLMVTPANPAESLQGASRRADLSVWPRAEYGNGLAGGAAERGGSMGDGTDDD